MRYMPVFGILFGFVLFAFTNVAPAHEIRPAIVTAEFNPDGTYVIKVKANAEVLLAGIGPEHQDTRDTPLAQHYETLRALSPEALVAEFRAFSEIWLAGINISFDRIRAKPVLFAIDVPPVGDLALPRLSVLTIGGQTPSGSPAFRWRYDPAFGSSVLRLRRADDGKMVAIWLKGGKQSEAIPVTGAPRQDAVEVFIQYVSLGFTHILPLGLDHILFVLGLYLLSARLRPILIQVTSFTIAHSFTLGLGLYGVVSVPPSVVEPLIAASIVFIAIENFMTDRLTPWRPYVVFSFGLIHGLGFAGVLHEVGLARDEFINGLIAFNVGVEFGQLAVIALAFLVTGVWFREKPWYRTRVVQPTSVIIGLFGAFWMFERVIA